MSDCDNCLCHLSVCEAECCKEFGIELVRQERCFPGKVISFIERDEDMLNYYKLHGCEVHKNIVSVKLRKFKQQGKRIIVYSLCSALTKDNLCSLHGTGRQPKVCEYPNKTGTGGNVYFTPRCVYKKKVMSNENK